MVLVTDIEWTDKDGNKRKSFYMDKWLVKNLEGIPAHLKKKWDYVMVISGTSLTRTGKSTLAIQIAYLVDWMIRGGKHIWDETGTKIIGMVKPKIATGPFDLDHVVFSMPDLERLSRSYYSKHHRSTCWVFDEGRQGLSAARAMERLNKEAQDYFDRCAFMYNFIIIVLPDFFKLGEEYACPRSNCLINVFHKNYIRGFFELYDTTKKELLYNFGKRLLGARARYSCVHGNFWGRFSSFFPLDADKYEQKKVESIGKKPEESPYARKFVEQRDVFLYMLYKELGMDSELLESKLRDYGVKSMERRTIYDCLRNAKKVITRQIQSFENFDEIVKMRKELLELDEGLEDDTADRIDEVEADSQITESKPRVYNKVKRSEDYAGDLSSGAASDKEFIQKPNEEIQDIDEEGLDVVDERADDIRAVDDDESDQEDFKTAFKRLQKGK